MKSIDIYTKRRQDDPIVLVSAIPASHPLNLIHSTNSLIKKVLLFAVVATAMLSLSIGVFGNKGISVNTQNGPGTGVITYQVNISASPKFLAQTRPVFVVLLNERGQAIGRPQKFNPRFLTYYFTEKGPVIGTRGTTLVTNPYLTPIPFSWSPDYISGKFLNNETYFFTIYVSDGL